MELRAYQREAVEAVYRHLRQRDDNPCVVLPTGCHAKGHPILMHDGSVKTVEDVTVGDLVMGPDSQPRCVAALCRGVGRLYRITPRRGEPFVVNEDHVLSLVCTSEGKGQFPCQKRGGEVDHLTVAQYLLKSRSWRHLRKLRRVAVDFVGTARLPIPPYILGLLLGDGCVKGCVALTTGDPDLAQIWHEYADIVGCAVREKPGRGCSTYYLSGARGRENPVTTCLRSLGLADTTSDDKFIPAIYKTASRSDRLDLLAGLIDADGYLHHGNIDLVTKSPRLAQDVAFIARSLGLAASIRQRCNACQTGAAGLYHRVIVCGHIERVPSRLARRTPVFRRQKKSVLRTGFTVEPAGEGDYYGFTLDRDHLYVDGHFMVHHNSGKTPVIATICRDAVSLWGGRVIVLAHVKELLAQAVDKLHAMAPDLWMQVGVYSAGLSSRDTTHPIIVAGIQSVYQKAKELGAFDICLIDESHLIPPDGDGMYRRFLEDARTLNPNLRVIGLTATPFRMSSGPICVPPPEGILNAVCYEVGVRELINAGYLSKLRSKAGKLKPSTDDLHIRGGEFVPAEVEALMDQDMLVHSACREIVEQVKSGGRKACLIFTSGVKHGQHVAQVIERIAGEECGFIDGETPSIFRDQIIRRFRDGDLRYLANVNVLTTGFDAPNVDCVALLRPTMSPGLYYQMCLDLETEVLTPKGWSRHDEVRTGDMVGTFELGTGNITFCQAQDKVHRRLAPGESMYGVVSPHMDIRVTDRHAMVYRGRSRTCLHWQKREARDLAQYKDSFHVPVAGEGEGPGVPLTDDELRLLGWFFTDGHRNTANNTIIITQSAASQHVPAIEAMLRGCGLGYRVYRRARTGEQSGYADGLQFVIPYGQPRGRNRHLRGWRHLSAYFGRPLLESLAPISRRQLRVMLEAMNLADGSKPQALKWCKRTLDLCIGEHKFLADQLQALCVLRGFRCNIAVQQRKTSWHRYNPKPQYILHVRQQQTATIGGAHSRGNALIRRRCRFGPVPFDQAEQVWCLTTEYGTLVTRRRGKVCIVGNCGRGFRLAPGKADCLVLDFGGNVVRHGPVDQIRVTDPAAKRPGEAPAKECPQCQALIATGYATCPECGFEFPPPERRKHEGTADSAGVLSGEVTITEYPVRSVTYSVHVKRDAPPDAPRSLRVDYEIGYYQTKSEWVCLEHSGYARQKAEAWWRLRSCVPVPDTIEDAVAQANAGALAEPFTITVRRVAGEKYDRIIDCELGAKPAMDEVAIPTAAPDETWDAREPEALPEQPDDDIPFRPALAA